MDRIQSIKDMMIASPDDSFLKHALALEYIKLGDDTAARQLFLTLLEKEPGYTGSYYHLGKLLERAGEETAAAVIYEKGMEMAKLDGDDKALSELRSALGEIID